MNEDARDMDAVDDEAGGEAFIRELVPDIVLGFMESGVRCVAEMGRHRGSGIDSRFDLITIRFGMADAGDYALADNRAYVLGRFRPLRRNGDKTDLPIGYFLPAVEFGDAGRTNVFERMSAARAVFR